MRDVTDHSSRVVIDLTVVVPLHNGASYIGETLNSLASQTIPVSEVIVVDDGSTDQGADIASTHMLAPRVVRQMNSGVAVARNHGALLATSTFIAFLDQDDLWLRHRNARLSRFLTANPDCRALVTTERSFYLAADETKLAAMGEPMHRQADFRAVESASSLGALEGDDGAVPAVVKSITTRDLLGGTVSVTTSYIFHRETFFQAGGCAIFARSLDDYWALLNISHLAAIVAVDEPSVLYRIHPTSSTMSTDWPRPLLTSLAAARYGGNLVRVQEARDSAAVMPLNDERGFWRHQLLSMSKSGSIADFLDAVALIRLLGCTARERHALMLRQTKATVGNLSRRIRKTKP